VGPVSRNIHNIPTQSYKCDTLILMLLSCIQVKIEPLSCAYAGALTRSILQRRRSPSDPPGGRFAFRHWLTIIGGSLWSSVLAVVYTENSTQNVMVQPQFCAVNTVVHLIWSDLNIIYRTRQHNTVSRFLSSITTAKGP